MEILENALIGVFVGGVYALSASGIVLTYTTTGVFNIAYFAIALLAAYIGWWLNGVVGVPLVPSVIVVLVVCGPVLGIVLERVVFRPLQVRRANSSEKLVAALGVTVLILGLIDWIWGQGVQGGVEDPVPRLFPDKTFDVGSFVLNTDQIFVALAIVALSAGLWFLLRRTFLGTSIRAVVDRRELAELASIDSNRVSQVAWTLGCSLAALTGLLIAAPVLEPQRIIFLGIETFSVAVVARLTSLPVAVLFGFGVMGLSRAVLDGFEPFGSGTDPARLWDAAVLNLSTILLLAVLLLYRRLDEVGDTSTGPGFVTGAFGRARRAGPAGVVVTILMVLAAVLAPAYLDGADLRLGQHLLALAVIFLSITCVTGFSGHITLGQASIAGLGAFATARFANAFDLPVLLAMVPGAGVALVAGLAAGWPALKRKGLFLGLTTLALALLIDRFVFNTPELFAGGPGGLVIERPEFFGLDLSGDTAFWFYELVVLGAMLLLARNLRSGRLGRVLASMRDSETAARSIGIDLRRSKLFVFGISSAMAGVGGALLTQADQNWDVTTFNPVFGLFWFVVVVVAGVASIRGAILAAVLYVVIPRVTDLPVLASIGVFGLLAALALGRMPGGLVGIAERLPTGIERLRERAWRAAAAPAADAAPVGAGLVPSEFAQRLLVETSNVRGKQT
jgi:branched-chain amino acid transport system permease protein